MSEGEYLFKLKRAVSCREMSAARETADRLLSQLDGFHKRDALDRLGIRGLHYKVVEIRDRLLKYEALLYNEYFHGQDGE